MSTGRRIDTSMSFETGAWITLRRTRGSRNFRAHLEQDLWSAWVVTHVNGRISSPLGRARSLPAPPLNRPCCSWPPSPNAGGNAATH